jgi:hypothetical protein
MFLTFLPKKMFELYVMHLQSKHYHFITDFQERECNYFKVILPHFPTYPDLGQLKKFAL